jgi:hypothetical protein
VTRTERFERRLAALAAVCIAAIAAFQALVAHPPMLWFDVDPASDPFPFAGLAPSTGMALDAVTLALSAIAIRCARRGIDRTGRWIAFLAGVGTLVAIVHGASSADQCWRAMQWSGAIMGGAALAVALRALGPEDGRVARRAAVAVLLAAVVPIAWRGALQVLVEHPATVAHYRAHKAEFLAARGWLDGSAQALTYERRLMQPEATAWFALSNVASSVLAAGAIAFAGAAAALRRVRPAGTVLLGIVAAACAALVGVNGSKGALAALAVGGAFAAWCAQRGPSPRARVHLALALLAMPLVAVGARAMVGPGIGERSLLFRAHYAEAALRMAGSSPAFGVGPSGFGERYLLVRPWDSPEEVQSAHAAWADWVASLGLGGVAWCVMLGVLVACAARSASARDGAAAAPAGPPPDAPGFRERLAPFAAAFLVATLAIVPESRSLDEASLAARTLAALLAATCASVLVRAFEAPGRAFAAALAGAALALAVHAQVEMTLWWPGAIAWVACMLGVAAAGAPADAPTRADAAAGGDPLAVPLRAALPRAALRAMLVLLLAHACLVLAFEVRGARDAERIVAAAAEPLAAFGRARLGIAPAPAGTLSEARFEAAEGLDPSTVDLTGGAPRTWLWLDRPAVAAASLSQRALGIASLPAAEPGSAPDPRIGEALGILAQRRASGQLKYGESEAAAWGFLAEAALARAAADGSDRSVAATQLRAWGLAQLDLNPRSVRGWMRAAEGAFALGAGEDAARFAGNAFGVDASYALDPLRRMTDAERARMQAIIDAAAPSRP